MNTKVNSEKVYQQPDRGTGRDHETSWLPALGFAFLTYNSFTAIYRSVGDPWTVAFVVASYLDLLLLFWCLRRLDKTPDESSHAVARGRLKKGVWMLATLLTLMFSYKVAEIMPWPAKIVIWAMSAVTIGGGFWAFFIYQDAAAGAAADADTGAKP